MTTAIFILAGIGVINTLYLSYHAITKTPVACIGFPPEWCLKVQQSPQSKTLGIPNSYLGLLMYIAVLVLTWLYVSEVLAFWPAAVVISAGFLFSMYFTGVQAFILKAYCTWCVISAIDFILLFASAIIVLTA
ncbi:MAG: hypothetical protein COW24_01115 [Candidatus Kerfeldbacteria bacterium CG15_BIG_FIL_POST_REV_8_21_14_020_45_12]|uniref:Vitamin K epoxide reductase domain-containing protein n=1 Tax=Candidatus Kerfeldbacteria bacterium CG15_BIG_FIL_POST_REV_8_21_14_020_45_12 TaxID=2014247 RepID=A0A2M7H4Y0_9BACT|nr:MAG: hypothetical protein COW24_01115 [Candidatus Kerfeldbacteria bacterium CG15_BIG_FIL_POST_REV_8_21_14_020_45_12]PJA93678.1 MAG: hypothetical protein CO132_01945 [Candidatus Kerfeldbacteria bacterium CG_4_9_14_3_um_filter_45_8]